MLTREKGVPLYYQLDTILRKKIMSGEIPAGAVFPTEDILVQDYNISRITVRQALASLQEDGLIVRKQGKGTFVSESIAKAAIKLTGTGKDLLDLFEVHLLPGITGKSLGAKADVATKERRLVKGYGSKQVKMGTKLLSYSRLPANNPVNNYLGITEGADMYRIERLRYTANKPLYHLLNYLPAEVGEKINQNLLKGKTLTEILEADLKIVIKQAVQTLEADTIDTSIGHILDVREGDPCLILRRVVYDQKDRVIEYLIATFRSDRYAYTDMLIRRKKGNGYEWLHV